MVVHSECVEQLQKTQQLDNKPLTNGDRIRAMSDAELAAVIMCPREHMTDPDAFTCKQEFIGCTGCCLDWLKQPAEVE